MSSLRASHLVLILWSTVAAATATTAANLPSAEECQANWPRFRGLDGSGVSANGDAPLTCSLKTGENVAWTAAVPAEGYSSPIVWQGKVLLTGNANGENEVLCFDASSGALLWQRALPKASDQPKDKMDEGQQSGMASSTAATDGRLVYALFANGDLIAVNFDGAIAWTKNLGLPKNPYGHAASLTTWQDRIFVQLDQGEADDKLSKVYAFDGASGNVVWEQPRSVGASWATPITIEAAGMPQIITLAVPWVISYSPKDGTELWRAECLDGEVTPSPIFAGGTLFVIHPSSKLQAIRPDGHGDVTQTHLGWMAEDGIPDVTSPVSNGELIFLVDSSGLVTCYDAKAGRKQWDHDLEEECNASPSIAGHHLYLITKKGTLVVVEAAREFKELGRSALGEEVLASPAFAQNKIFVRGMKHLICIGQKATPP